MNKYLEKIASQGEEMGKVKEPLPAKDPGSKLIRGAKTLFQHAQIKTAGDATISDEPKNSVLKDAINTATVGAAGGATGWLTHKILHPKAPKGEGMKALGVSTVLGLAGDYAAVKANNAINKHLDKAASLFPSIKYQKTLDKNEKREYASAYKNAPFHHIAQSTGSSLAIGAGTVAGMAAGSAMAKPLGKKLADRIKDRGIISGKYRMADGSHNLQHILHDGLKVRRRVNSILPLAGIVLGAIPGSSWADHYRHDHAKNKIEKRRNTND